MVRKSEPGSRITVTGKLLDAEDEQPIENVVVEIVHADSSGLYFPEKSTFNPRLFSYLKTGKSGQFTIYSIRPGSYLDDSSQPVPSHMHFTLEKEGYRTYTSEFIFEDDPIFKANGNIDMVPMAVEKDNDHNNHYEVEIHMQREE